MERCMSPTRSMVCRILMALPLHGWPHARPDVEPRSQRGAFLVQRPQAVAGITVARDELADRGPELGAVVELLEMRDLVRDHVLHQLEREVHQPPVQPDDAVRGAAAPAGARGRQAPARRLAAQALAEDRQALAEDAGRFGLQPRVNAVAHLASARTGRQADAQGGAIADDAVGPGTDLHAQAPAEISQRLAVGPSHREAFTTLLVLAPFDELRKDPAGLLLERRVELPQRVPGRSGDGQPAFVDLEADRAATAAPEMVVDALPFEDGAALARPRGRWGHRGDGLERQRELQRAGARQGLAAPALHALTASPSRA